MTSNNRVVAYEGDTVIDEGVDNRITYRPTEDDDDDDDDDDDGQGGGQRHRD